MDPASAAGDEQPGTEAAAAERVIESAKRLGVELDAHEAAEWVAAMATEASGGDVVVNVDSGVYGHRVTMLDFQPEDLARFREMSTIVGFADRPPQVLTALSISGSAAQSKINAYPADCDFFERVHITAETRAEACAILADLIREKALDTATGPTHRLWEVKFGSHPVASTKGGVADRGGFADVLDPRGGPRRPDGGDARRRLAARLHLGGGVARAGLVQARLGDRGQDPRAAGQREQRARSDLGGAGRHDHPARRLPRPLLPGGLPRGGVDPALLPPGQGALGRLGRRLRGDARARGLEVHRQGAELRQGRAADVQRLPDERALPRGGVHPRAVRRAGDRAVPGVGAHPDARRCGELRRDVRRGHDGRPVRRTDHVGDPGAGRSRGSDDGRPPAEPSELAPGA